MKATNNTGSDFYSQFLFLFLFSILLNGQKMIPVHAATCYMRAFNDIPYLLNQFSKWCLVHRGVCNLGDRIRDVQV